MSSQASEKIQFQDLQALFAEVFKVDPSQVDANAQLGEWPLWDSMAHMDLILAMESRFGVEINAENISRLISIPAILEYLQSRD
jgi:acyl carrier protein